MTLTLENLKTALEVAKRTDAQFFGIKVELPDMIQPEIIINSIENVEIKQKYFVENYSDSLELIRNPSVRIIGFTYGDSFSDIQRDLL